MHVLLLARIYITHSMEAQELDIKKLFALVLLSQSLSSRFNSVFRIVTQKNHADSKRLCLPFLSFGAVTD